MQNDPKHLTITFIGIGLMGSRMTQRLLNPGFMVNIRLLIDMSSLAPMIAMENHRRLDDAGYAQLANAEAANW